jgi:tetratricopeptide (TPR) repeat protein
MEMVDGADVANRLDELFTEDSSNTETMGMELPKTEPESPADSETMVTGEEVASRISEIFEPAKDATSGLKTTMSTPSQSLQPLTDEEDAYPEEAESVSQTEGGANVATVTLAEIYFQQGLREQALQIYRQLLELEPGNDSVRSRINEIEASRPDGENQEPGGSEPGEPGPDSNTRRPRPGFKIPKRKK